MVYANDLRIMHGILVLTDKPHLKLPNYTWLCSSRTHDSCKGVSLAHSQTCCERRNIPKQKYKGVRRKHVTNVLRKQTRVPLEVHEG